MTDKQAVSKTTPANIVTIIRICLVPVFVAALLCSWPEWIGLDSFSDDNRVLVAAVIFILISCTDWLDGYLARSRNEVTDFGKFMDPLADKILVAAALIALVELGSLPTWVALIILAREFVISGVRMMAATKGEVIAASYLGKFKTVFTMIAIVLFTVKDTYVITQFGADIAHGITVFSWVIMIIALLLTIASMIDYIAKARHIIGFGSSRQQKVANEDYESLNLALAADIIAHASARGVSLGTAESLTGGLIASTLTTISGSSSVVRGGIVSYVNDVKHDVLHVDGTLLDSEGPVNAMTAEQMAEGARCALACDIAVSVTGIAGPTGAEEGKPVGTVFMGVSREGKTYSKRFQFKGDRDEVRLQTVNEALKALLSEIEG